MNNLPESIEFQDVIILASYVDSNLFLILLKEGGNEIAVQEIAGMRVVSTTTYKLPISLNEFIKKNTYMEFYDEPLLDSFKGRARVKIFRTGTDIYLVIDDKQLDASKTDPNLTHVLHLDKAGDVRHQRFTSTGKADFGSFLFDGKLFQNHILKEKFSLVVYDLSGKQLMRYDVRADSLDVGKKEPNINYRQGREPFQGWDNFGSVFKNTGMSDPVLVVSEIDMGCRIQCGTYFDEKGVGYFPGGAGALAAAITFSITAALKQAADGPGLSRYFLF